VVYTTAPLTHKLLLLQNWSFGGGSLTLLFAQGAIFPKTNPNFTISEQFNLRKPQMKKGRFR
jgi:hypothetical protein